jgi:hypothetical protein
MSIRQSLLEDAFPAEQIDPVEEEYLCSEEQPTNIPWKIPPGNLLINGIKATAAYGRLSDKIDQNGHSEHRATIDMK